MMSYLVCDNCGGSYELQHGESPEDFDDKCECGGNLKHVLDLNSDVDVKSNISADVKVCPKCGKENDNTTRLCVSCGQKLNKNNFMSFNPVLSIVLGIIPFNIVIYLLTVFKGNTSQIAVIGSLIIGGFIATYFSKEKKMQYAIIAGIGIFAIDVFITLIYHLSNYAAYIIMFFTIFLFTSIGGFIGVKLDHYLR